MLSKNKDFCVARGFTTPPPTSKSKSRLNPWQAPWMPISERKRSSPVSEKNSFHVMHKVPAGDSPYVKAKRVQLIDKDPNRAISMFWASINAGDRVDSALKDMALTMKQLDRSDEAIEAIKSFRHLCPLDSQESLDNILVELYKRSGRIDEEIEMLLRKLKQIEEGTAFDGKRTKQARSQGKKIQITIEQELSRVLGNLAWTYMQKHDYKSAEEYYRKALSLEADRNKQCNLAICLMHMQRTAEAKFLLQAVKASLKHAKMDESYAKSFERACSIMTELEAHSNSQSRNEVRQWQCPLQVKNDDNCKRGGYIQTCHNKASGFATSKADNCDKSPSMEVQNDTHDSSYSTSCRLNHRNRLCVHSYFNPSSEAAVVVGGGEIEHHAPFISKKTLTFDRNSLELSGTAKATVKKSWADIMEEEEELSRRKFESLGEEYADENLNSNIISTAEKISEKLEAFDLRDAYEYGACQDAFVSRNSTVQRTLCFGVQLKQDSNDCLPSSTFLEKASDEDQKKKATEKNSMSWDRTKPKKSNRLQVFKDITESSSKP